MVQTQTASTWTAFPDKIDHVLGPHKMCLVISWFLQIGRSDVSVINLARMSVRGSSRIGLCYGWFMRSRAARKPQAEGEGDRERERMGERERGLNLTNILQEIHADCATKAVAPACKFHEAKQPNTMEYLKKQMCSIQFVALLWISLGCWTCV